MKDQWEGMQRPPGNPDLQNDWLSQLGTFQGGWGPPLWAGEQNAINQGERVMFNPSSPASPYANSGLPGTYRSADANRNTFGAGPGVGSPAGASSAAGAPTYWNPAGFAAATPGTTHALEAAAMPNFLAGLGGAGAAMTGIDWFDRLAGLGELFGNTASQRAGERNLESLANAANYRTQQDALLRALQLAMLSQQQLPGQMTRANLMANPPADLKLSHPRATMPNIQGGIQMGNLTSGASQALGEAMKKSALERGLKGYDTAGMVLPPPEYLRGNALDTLLNAGGFAGGVANALRHGTGKT